MEDKKKGLKWMKMLGGELLGGLGGAMLAGSMKKGGKVKKAGIYKLHKGERVISTKSHRTLDR